MPKPHKRPLSSRIPLRLNICISFVLFTAIISGLLWMTETVLLERLYTNSKIRETRALALSLISAYSSQSIDEFKQTLTNAAVNDQICISLYDSRTGLP